MSKWSSAYRDSRWQKKRLEVMERDGFTCCSCGKGEADGTFLNVHHAYYEKGNAPWEYDDKMLKTLCEQCHKRIHDFTKSICLSICDSSGAAAITAGYASGIRGMSYGAISEACGISKLPHICIEGCHSGRFDRGRFLRLNLVSTNAQTVGDE